MHNLTPEFILQKLAEHETQGQFAAVVLFVDTSGFTPLTTALLQHGTEGAEIIAQVLANLFTPLFEIVYGQAGFIAGFAGDAFKAIFPGLTAATYHQALTAAWQIRQHLAAHPVQQTRFGDFPFALKVTVAAGSVEWSIWQSTASNSADQPAAAIFGGSALAEALAADPLAKAGEIVLTPAVAAHIARDGVTLAPVASHFRLDAWSALLDQPLMPRPDRSLTPSIAALATHFFPPELLTRQVQGEFRRVVTVFINLQTLPSVSAVSPFATTLFRLLAQYGGYLCRIGQIGDQDQGGTLLLFWGAPTAYEQDVARALHFLLALQAAAPTRLRAGVTTALAYAGFVGAPQREEYTCYGAHVNQAARQMVRAAWDEIWLDDETVRLAGAAFVCTQHGAFRFKGFSEERTIYRLLGQRESRTENFYQGTLVGRQAELEQLAAALAPLAEGQFAGVLTIIGEAGIGKSRLVHELQRQLENRQEDKKTERQENQEDKGIGEDNIFLSSRLLVFSSPQWFLCQTDEILRQPLNPFRYWLRGYFNQSTSADEAANKAAFTAKLDDLLTYLNPLTANSPPITRHTQLATEIARTRSFLGALIDLHWPDSLYAQVEPQLRFENTLAALKTLILAESLRQPVILHLEDAHWLDADSRTLLARLTYNVADYPLAIIVTRRPGEETGRQGDTRQGDTRQGDEAADPLGLEGPQVLIRLTTLSVDEIRALAAAQLQGDLAPALVTLIEERAEGNPFFAEQLLRYLQEQAWLVQGAAGWQLRTDQVATTLLPSGARALLVARLDQLPQTVKEVVQTAAVLGREFDTTVLAQMLTEDQSLAAKLAVADRAAIWHAMTQARYLFRHALLREAAYDMQLRARLRTLHHRAGAALEQVYGADLTPYLGELAYHYDQAEVREAAAYWYGQAGEQASKQYANETAARYFRRALELTPVQDITTRYELLLGSEAAHNWLGQRQPQQDDLTTLEAVAALLNDNAKRSEVLLRKTAFHLSTGRYQEAVGYAEQAVAFAVQAEDTLAEARAYHRWGRSFWQAGDYQQARPHLVSALKMARTYHHVTEEAQACYDLGIVDIYLGNMEQVFHQVEQAIKLYKAIGDKRGQSSAQSLYAAALDKIGNNLKAIEQFDEALNLCREVGWRYAEARISALNGNNLLNLGALVISRDYHTKALQLYRDTEDLEGIATSQDTLGLICLFQNRLEDAKQIFLEALSIHQRMNNQRGQGYVLTHLGCTLLQTQEWTKAMEALQQALTIRRVSQPGGVLLDTLAACAFATLMNEQAQQALQYVEEILDWLAEHGTVGIEFPAQVYLFCYKVLLTLANLQPEYGVKAVSVLEAGYAFVQERASLILNATLQGSFLQNIPFHREILQLWQAQVKAAEVC